MGDDSVSTIIVKFEDGRVIPLRPLQVRREKTLVKKEDSTDLHTPLCKEEKKSRRDLVTLIANEVIQMMENTVVDNTTVEVKNQKFRIQRHLYSKVVKKYKASCKWLTIPILKLKVHRLLHKDSTQHDKPDDPTKSTPKLT